jgi:tetratricopeptide (TPR) repeat protein
MVYKIFLQAKLVCLFSLAEIALFGVTSPNIVSASNSIQAGSIFVSAAQVPSPQTASDYYNSGIRKVEKQDYQGALADYNRAIQLAPDSPLVYNNRGFLKDSKLQDYKGALADYNRAIQLNPGLAKIYDNRGTLKMGRFQDYKGALTDYNRAVQLSPSWGRAYGNRGALKYLHLNDKSGGISDTQQAARLFKEQGDMKGYQVAISLIKKWRE